ncbi:MAG: TlpA disulfide reductase family protein [Proteiniphilum sp.]|nr:TlpA disulfide reductase family protein [Proteiniphilum sp.]MDD4415358.1 TlpA disulfide reductase family protein [Proteiniphilum sp.]
MKTKTFLTLLLVAVALSSQAQTASSFTLQGKIEGVQKGDTIIVSIYDVPDWNVAKRDTLIVQQDNYFQGIIPIQHTEYLTLMHFPKNGTPLPSSKMALTFLAGKNDKITLTGNVEYFVLSDIKGGFYDNPLIQSVYTLEREYDKKGIDIYRNIEKHKTNNQKDSVQFYAEQYNTRRRPEELRTINDSIANRTHDTEYAAFRFLMNNFDWDYSAGKSRFEKFNSEIKDSYFGKKAEELIRKKGMLEVGNTPPDFMVVTNKGIERKLSSYKGDYLLLYYWGMCPASIQISPQLVEFYNSYHPQGLEILSITKDDALKSQPQLKENPEIWARFKDFLSPPWDVVYEVEGKNTQMASDYIFNVLPTVMLISPEGKTLFRGYNEYEAMKKEFLDDFNKRNAQ